MITNNKKRFIYHYSAYLRWSHNNKLLITNSIFDQHMKLCNVWLPHVETILRIRSKIWAINHTYKPKMGVNVFETNWKCSMESFYFSWQLFMSHSCLMFKRLFFNVTFLLKRNYFTFIPEKKLFSKKRIEMPI